MFDEGNLTSRTDTCTTSPFPRTRTSVTCFDLVGVAMFSAMCQPTLMTHASCVWPLSRVRAGVTGLRCAKLTVTERLASYSPRECGIKGFEIADLLTFTRGSQIEMAHPYCFSTLPRSEATRTLAVESPITWAGPSSTWHPSSINMPTFMVDAYAAWPFPLVKVSVTGLDLAALETLANMLVVVHISMQLLDLFKLLSSPKTSPSSKKLATPISISPSKLWVQPGVVLAHKVPSSSLKSVAPAPAPHPACPVRPTAPKHCTPYQRFSVRRWKPGSWLPAMVVLHMMLVHALGFQCTASDLGVRSPRDHFTISRGFRKW